MRAVFNWGSFHLVFVVDLPLTDFCGRYFIVLMEEVTMRYHFLLPVCVFVGKC